MWKCSIASHAFILGLTSSATSDRSPATKPSDIEKPNPARVREDRYMLPVLDRYEIHKHDFDDEPWGRRSLVEGRRSSEGDFGGSFVVGHVESYAVSAPWIVGKTTHGYFVFNTQGHDRDPKVFANREEWQAALAAAGISANTPMLDPDAAARALPDQVLRPWNYHYMRGVFGLTDGDWAGIVWLVGLAVAFAVGLLIRNRYAVIAIAVFVGLVVNVVGEIILSGGGGPAFVGFCCHPLMAVVAAYLAIGTSRLVSGVGSRRREQQVNQN